MFVPQYGEYQEMKKSAAEGRKPEFPDRETTQAAASRFLSSHVYRKRKTLWDIAALVIVVATLLFPFAGKAFNIDDPLFIWAAQQIIDHPNDFYGFLVNWYGHEMPMYDVMKNPPLTSYFIALVAFLFGLGEVPLHMSFLAFAVAATIGIYFLARELCPKPLLATLAGILNPAFVVSSNTVMCDIPMLAFWIWAVVFWIYGLKRDSLLLLVTSAVLICFSALNKYFGISLVPLLFAYSLAEKRSLGPWCWLLLAPLVVIGLYELATSKMYGRGLFSDAVAYASSVGSVKNIHFISQGVICLAFMGGGFISALFLAPYTWSWRVAAAGLIIAVIVFFLLCGLPKIGDFPLRELTGGIRWDLVIQISLFIVAGVMILAVSALDLIENKNGTSILLFTWVLGTFIFAAFVNWTTNIRSILPVAPAVGILFMRRIYNAETHFIFKDNTPLPFFLVACSFLTFLVTWADASLANTGRSAAYEIARNYGGREVPLWFQGHWGFQYYMQEAGGRPLDFRWPGLEKGALVVIPTNNTNLQRLPPNISVIVGVVERQPFSWASTMNGLSGAGYYSSIWGPIPYAFGVCPLERYIIYRMTAALY